MTELEINEYLRLKPAEEAKLISDTQAQAIDPGYTDRYKQNLYTFQRAKVEHLQAIGELPMDET